MSLELCKKCGNYLGWYYGYCLDCWGKISEDKKALIKARRILYKEGKRLQRRRKQYVQKTT